MTKKKLILDCDPGTDDAQAILIALANEETEVVAITVVAGNTSLDNAAHNTVRLLKYFKRSEIPVYKGCSNSLLSEPRAAQDFHGPDGFGGITIPDVDPVDLSSIQKEHASVALCRLVSADPGNITLVATGPLTNVAVALMMDAEFGKKLKDFIVMGGNYKARGNVAPAAEFNWFTDPEAAYNVFVNMKRIITMVPLETCFDYSFAWDWYENAISRPTRAAWFIKSIDALTVDRERNQCKAERYWVWDQLAVAVFVNPSVIAESHEVYATVELHGHHTRGQAVVDWSGSLGKPANVRIVTKVDQALCEKIVMTAFTIM